MLSIRKFGGESANLPEVKDHLFPHQRFFVSPVYSAFFPLSFSFSPILSGVLQMNSLVWPKLCPYENFMFAAEVPAYCPGLLQ